MASATQRFRRYWLGRSRPFGCSALLGLCKALATSISLGSGSSGGIFSPSLFMGAALGGAFAALWNVAGLPIQLSVPAFAMVGMGAMVGGGTGAVMTAVTMIFEMTLDYSIVMPMIVAVAMSIGVRRVLSRETIYTLKLVRRGRAIPKARHANMFLVRSAREVMDADIQVLPAEASFDDYLRQPEHAGRLRHVVVTDKGHLFGVIRVNTGLRRGLEGANTGLSSRRCRQPKLHRGARRRDCFRRHPPHVAAQGDHGSGRAGPRSTSWQRRCRRDHQGTRGGLGRRQRKGLPGVGKSLPFRHICRGERLSNLGPMVRAASKVEFGFLPMSGKPSSPSQPGGILNRCLSRSDRIFTWRMDRSYRSSEFRTQPAWRPLDSRAVKSGSGPRLP